MQIHVCAVKAELPVSKRKFNEIAEETEKDEVLKQVIRSINDDDRKCDHLCTKDILALRNANEEPGK